jgi:hypothetical protein
VSLKSGTVGVASGEFSLFAFLPWKRRGYTPLKYFIPNASEICGAFCLAGLFCTHVLSAIVFAPIALLYSLFLGRRSFRRCILVGVWAVLLSAAYLLPSVLYASYTSGYRNSVFLGEEISNTFLFHGSPQSEPLTVRIIFISMMVICGVSIAFVKYTDRKHTRTQLVFWIIMLSLCLVMMVRISEPLYACLPVLRRIQFVSRFLSPATLATCVLLAFLMNQWRQHRFGLRLLTGMAMFVFVIPMLAINIRGYSLAFGPERVTNGKMAGIDATGEYLPGSGNLFKARELFPVTRSNGSSDIRILSGSGRASLEPKSARHFLLNVQADTEMEIILHQFWFPKWVAFAHDKTTVKLNPDADSGLLKIQIPKGQHQISIRLQALWPEQVGWWISLVSVLFCLLNLQAARHFMKRT